MVRTIATTDRLTLREWSESDEPRFYAVMNNPDVMRWLGGVQTPEQWHAVVERLLGYQRDLGFTFWIVERRDDGELLGWCGLKRMNYAGAPNPGEMEIGWRYRADAWGQGIAKEAAIAALDLAFGRFAAPSVVAVTFEQNAPSWGLMERLGMSFEPALDFVDPRFADVGPTRQWRLLAEDWPEARARALAPRLA
ncbi:GNAT family N-acetyltransferase [Sphingomonas swuensis]|uniref:GNAT family N-acetyltransferase n=1 Tax=Sphingomonas swuensis TaxID=977800 RepID=A0ABP7SNN2_9SPHN